MKNRRSLLNYSIKRQMQFRLLSRVMAIALIATGLAAVFFYFYSNQEISHSFKQFHMQARNFLDFLLPAIIIALVISIVIAFGMAIVFPHKIAGPLHRIERDVREKVGEGNLTVKFGVRKGDELKELADALNGMVEGLKLKIGRVKTTSEELASHAVNMHADNDSLKKLSELTKRLEEAVKEFRL